MIKFDLNDTYLSEDVPTVFETQHTEVIGLKLQLELILLFVTKLLYFYFYQPTR